MRSRTSRSANLPSFVRAPPAFLFTLRRDAIACPGDHHLREARDVALPRGRRARSDLEVGGVDPEAALLHRDLAHLRLELTEERLDLGAGQRIGVVVSLVYDTRESEVGSREHAEHGERPDH